MGSPSTKPPDDLHEMPRYPIVIEGDIPFLINYGFISSGPIPNPMEKLDYIRSNCKMHESADPDRRSLVCRRDGDPEEQMGKRQAGDESHL